MGLGRSLGGMVLVVLQASGRPFEGIVVLGHGGGGLPEVLTDEESALVGSPHASPGQIVELAARRFGPGSTVARTPPRHGVFFAEDVPPAVVTAMAGQQAELLSTCGLETLLPGSSPVELAAIDVPSSWGWASGTSSPTRARS